MLLNANLVIENTNLPKHFYSILCEYVYVLRISILAAIVRIVMPVMLEVKVIAEPLTISNNNNLIKKEDLRWEFMN